MTESFPPPGFIATPSSIEGIEVYMLAPPEEEHRPVVAFDCPQCGANTAYGAADDGSSDLAGLSCTHCGYYEAPQKEAVGKNAEDFEFTVQTMERAARGWGETRLELQCQNCGVYTTVAPDTLTHTCPFCGSRKVIQRQAPQDALRPRFLVPFQLKADACHAIIREWLGKTWMLPRALQRTASLGEFGGVYIPYWTFDARNKAAWKAEVGRKEKRNTLEGAKTKIVWKWESGTVNRFVDDLLIPGAARLSSRLLKRIGRYDLNRLTPYEPTYLAGFQAQAYDIPLEKAWETARQQMREKTRKLCRSQTSTSRVRNFSMRLDFQEETWRYILLPIYIIPYTYQGKNYQVMINGQNGDIAGQRPVDWLKVWLAVTALLTPGALTGIAGLLMYAIAQQENCLPLMGFVLFMIGMIFAAKIAFDASQLGEG